MKLKSLIYTSVAALCFTACSNSDEPAMPQTSAVTFEISDGGFAGESRAAEDGYRTRFTAGDACGLYVARNGSLVYDNVKLTAAEDVDGSIIWQSDAPLGAGLPGEKYFLYYPYQENMSGKVTASATDAIGFFAPLVNGWQPAADQSDYAAYTASDLMTAQGTAAKASDGSLRLSFAMSHRMALAVIEMPTTTYKFTNSDGRTPDYFVSENVDFSSNTIIPYTFIPGTFRCVVKPNTSDKSINGLYSNEKCFKIAPTISGGQYKTYKIDGGTKTEIQHNIQIGDFLMKDGTLLSKDATLTDQQKADVAAIVFWTPSETNPTGRNTPASLSDDKIMAAEYPQCIHGLAVALKDIPNTGSDDTRFMEWQKKSESVTSFQYSENFIHPLKDSFVQISSKSGMNDNINYILGYQNTSVLLAYNQYCEANNQPEHVVIPVALMNGFANDNPAPKMSTGWFLPSVKELHLLNYKDVDNIWNQYDYGLGKTDAYDIVCASLSAIGAETIISGTYYWSSTESLSDAMDKAYYVNIKAAVVNSHPKTHASKSLRVICAF